MFYFSSGAARDGAYIHGLFMEGARWDIMQGVIMESKLKELFPQMPVINVRVSMNTNNNNIMYIICIYLSFISFQIRTMNKFL